MQTLSGRQLGGFSIGERLALGGMAAIYRATQISTEREVAVKVLPLHLAGDPKLAARFEREARVLASLQHPHILPLIDFGREGEWLYLVTPLITHGDLADRLARWGEPLPLDEVRQIMRQLTDALDAAHRAGIVHRDLKPANVLIDARGNCLLSDFGIAKLEGAMGLTAAGTALGTPEYMAPEQGAGRPVDARCDIYALGVILYELCTHRVPFEAESPTALLLKHLSEPPPPPRTFNQKLPPALEQVILRALAKEPAQRYASAEAMGRAVAQAIPRGSDGTTTTRETVVMRPPQSAPTVVQPRVEPATRHARRRGATWAAASVLGVLLAAGVWWLSSRPPVVSEWGTKPAPAPSVAAARVSPAAAPEAAPPGADSAGPPEPGGSGPPAAGPVATGAAARSATYDDFQGESLDTDRWAPTLASTRTDIVQSGGVLKLQTEAVNQFHGAYATAAPKLGQPPGKVGALVRFSGGNTAKQSSVGVTVSAFAPGAALPAWWVSCYLYAKAGSGQATPMYRSLDAGWHTLGAPAAFTRQHALRLTFAPGTESVVVSADGAPVATVKVPPFVRAAGTSWGVSLVGWSEDGAPVTGEFDDVVID